jgi:DNA-binding response OmpR family regulator
MTSTLIHLRMNQGCSSRLGVFRGLFPAGFWDTNLIRPIKKMVSIGYTMDMRVLIVDDEKRIVDGVRKYFEQAGFIVLAAYDGPTGLKMATKDNPDLVVLDLMLPGMDGLDVCREIRKESNVPIIMLTARVEETDKLIGLELGADDYVIKPFSPRELVARVRAVLRRTMTQPVASKLVYQFGNVILDTAARECRVDGEIVSLTPTEYDLLYHLVRHPNQVCSRSQLLEAADLGVYEGVERTIDVHIHNLRKKIEPNPASLRHILTVFGIGYRFIK